MNRREALSWLGLGSGLAAAPLAAQPLVAQPRLVGMAVGINQYSALRPLVTARQDAASISVRLTEIGYAMEPHPELSTTDGIIDSFIRFIERIEPSSGVFLFLAGHGLQLDGRNYFLPANTPTLDKLDALAEALPLDFFLDAISKARPRQAIVVLDACRDDGVGAALPGYAPGIASTNAPGGCFIAYSAGFGEFALDRVSDEDHSPNGLFTRHLLQHMQGEQRIYDIISATRTMVSADAAAIGHAQHPAIYDQSRRAYFLDGIERRAAAAPVPTAGTLSRTGIVLVAREGSGCVLPTDGSPKNDAVRLHRALTALGASVVGLLDPSREEVLVACKQLAGRDFDEFAFVWLGRGVLHELQVAALFDAGACSDLPAAATAAASQRAAVEGVALLTHSDVIASFRSKEEEDTAQKAAQVLVVKPLTMFFDCGLAPVLALDKPGGYSSEIPLNNLPFESQLPPRFQDVALLAAASEGAEKAPAPANGAGSVFVTALINALGRPGLTLDDLSELVLAEVETLSGGAQSPLLVASRKAERRVFVKRADVTAAV